MSLLRAVEITQPDYQWQYQLRHERDVTAQSEAIKALERFSTPATRLALTDIIENENCFYKVRCEATFCLAKVIVFSSSSVLRTETLFFGRSPTTWSRAGPGRLPC